MNLKKLSDQELDQSLLQSVKAEREALSDVLHHIVEVERRKLYLKRGYPSLFKYLTEHLKLSNGTAQRRIDAARLMKDFPALREKLESGNLNLGHVSIVQKAIRQKRNETSALITREEKHSLMMDLIGKSEIESQKIVAQAFNLEVKECPKVQYQKDESVRLEVTFGKEQWAKLERMRELLSNSLPDGSWQEVLTYVAEKVIQQKTKIPASRASTNRTAANKEGTVKAPSIDATASKEHLKQSNIRATSSKVPLKQSTKTTPPTSRVTPTQQHLKHSTKKAVLNRDVCCQYQDSMTGKQCTSRWNLQIDHIQHRWDNGSHEPENLQVLCAAHNRQRYRQQAGIH